MSTIAEVAKEAGVSVATVSRVINGNAPISEETLERVTAAISKLNYQPNVWGRRLRKKESKMILIFVPNIRNPYYASIVSGIEDTAKNRQYGTMLCITNGDKSREKEFVELLRTGQADGAIVMTVEKNDTEILKLAGQLPIVQCCEYHRKKEMTYVSIDNFQAARQVVRYLLDLGHEAIGFIGSTNKFISSEERQQGYEAALKEGGRDVNSSFLAYADEDYNFQSGVRAAKKLLGQEERPTAIFCISDVLALAAVRVAGEMGIVVGKELSIVGFDDVEYATMFHPMLTTVSQPRYAMGKMSAELLIRKMETGENFPGVYLEHQIILRDSTAGRSRF